MQQECYDCKYFDDMCGDFWRFGRCNNEIWINQVKSLQNRLHASEPLVIMPNNGTCDLWEKSDNSE